MPATATAGQFAAGNMRVGLGPIRTWTLRLRRCLRRH